MAPGPVIPMRPAQTRPTDLISIRRAGDPVRLAGQRHSAGDARSALLELWRREYPLPETEP